MTALAALATHFLHFGNFQIEPGPGVNLGEIGGEDLTRAAICVPLFLMACFVILSSRFPWPRKAWGLGTFMLSLGSWIHLAISNWSTNKAPASPQVASPNELTADFGHVFLGVLNQNTRNVRFLDYWAASGPPGRGVVNSAMTLDRLRDHASITIQTSPEAAQELIETIDKIAANPPDYTLVGSMSGPQGMACTILCQDVLKEIGIDLGDHYLPWEVWQDAFERYASPTTWRPATGVNPGLMLPSKPLFALYQPGRGFGTPRFPGVDLNDLLFSALSEWTGIEPKRLRRGEW
jgi:hypothetical protein